MYNHLLLGLLQVFQLFPHLLLQLIQFLNHRRCRMLLYMFLQEDSVHTIPPPYIQAKSVITPAILVNFLVFIKTPLKPTTRLFFDFEAFYTTFVNATHKKLCWINLPTSICASYI